MGLSLEVSGSVFYFSPEIHRLIYMSADIEVLKGH